MNWNDVKVGQRILHPQNRQSVVFSTDTEQIIVIYRDGKVSFRSDSPYDASLVTEWIPITWDHDLGYVS